MSKSKIEEYYKFDPTDANLWRTINLFGVNTASYKFALAKSLLKLGIENKTEIKLIELAEPFAKFTCEHLKINFLILIVKSHLSFHLLFFHVLF